MKKRDNILAIISIILVVITFGGTYYFVIAPNIVSKPFIKKPFLPKDGLIKIKAKEHVINSSHINYLINEMGFYRLKKKLETEDYLIMEFILTDIDETYYTYVKDNTPVTKRGNVKHSDIIIGGNQKIIFNILQSDNIHNAIKEAEDNNLIARRI